MIVFADRLCRLLFATEVTSMSLHFSYPVRIVQHSVAPTLYIGAVLQRSGRPTRSSTSEGVGIQLYTTNAVIDDNPGNSLATLMRKQLLGTNARNVRSMQQNRQRAKVHICGSTSRF